MKTSERLRRYLTAITFAEAGEWDTAREMLPPSPAATPVSWETVFAAVTFAEAGVPEVALQLMGRKEEPRRPSGFLQDVGLYGIRVTYGVMAA